ncbi:MAG: RNA polymerase subunit sigma-24 [Chlorobiales bacterium]|nr:RNA polymerase subunit sigma-24 [Chlorobiales bacterium]
MVTAKRTPLDLMDDIYSLAYWLTASEMEATELVNNTYLNVYNDSSEAEVLKIFRSCYFDTLEQEDAFILPETPCFPLESHEVSMLKEFADKRLSVLLSAIVGLKHRSISRIIGKPLNTIRLWLSEGRKSLVYGKLLNAST